MKMIVPFPFDFFNGALKKSNFRVIASFFKIFDDQMSTK